MPVKKTVLSFPNAPVANRRDFLKGTTVAAGGALAGLTMSGYVHAEGAPRVIKVGLIGCGGRGTGAAGQALAAGPDVHLVAMADAFEDHLDKSYETLQGQVKAGVVNADQLDVPKHQKFVGLDAYKKLLATDVDVVLLVTPPHFRPQHFAEAIAKGKHVFAEKPVAVDARGVHSVLETAKLAAAKNLSVVCGFCYRYDLPKRECMKQVHAGMIGDIVALHALFNTQAITEPKARKPEWSDLEWQLRNWPYHTWLSGDFIVEQHVHNLDKAAWAMQEEMPVKATSLGGRQSRVAPEFGNIFDHFSTVFEYKNGVKLFSSCRQQVSCSTEVNDYLIGTKGVAQVMSPPKKKPIITLYGNNSGKPDWKYEGEAPSMYQVEHNELFESIRKGKPINDGQRMANSSMMGIMGRMAGYTGQTITWDQAMGSQQDLTPRDAAGTPRTNGGEPRGDNAPLAVGPVAKPGFTAFV